MTVAEDFLLLTTDPKTGKCLLSSTIINSTLGSANLIDLVMAGKVELTGNKSKARVVLIDREPTGSALIDRSIHTLQTKGPMRTQAAVKQLGKKSKDPIYEALVAQGEVRREKSKVLGLFTVTRHPVTDTVRRDMFKQQIQSSLLFGIDATEETGPLVGLLSASDKLRIVVDRPELRKAKARAKVIAEGDWASEEVRKAIQAANTAMMVAVIAATSAGAAGSS